MDLEFENIVLIVTFLVLISLVYLTGFIVWVCCRRSESSTSSDVDCDYKRPMFPVASPSPFPPAMTSHNFPLHALVLLLIALNDRNDRNVRNDVWNATTNQTDNNEDVQNRVIENVNLNRDLEIGQPLNPEAKETFQVII